MKYLKWQWIAKALVFGTLFIIAVGTATMFLWNAIAAGVFGLAQLTFWQALGLLVLVRMLTGNFGPRRRGGPGFMRGNYMREKWQQMSEAERMEMMRGWGKHGCRPKEQNPGAEPSDIATA